MTANTQDSLGALDIKEIVKILPHRYPFLLVDKIIEINREQEYIIGQKNVSMNESFFQGHFPDAPIMPGVLVLEALAQTGAVFIHLKGNRDKIAVLLNVNNAKFRIPVRPGDVMLLRCENAFMSSKGGRFKAQALVNGKTAVEAEIGFVLVDKQTI